MQLDEFGASSDLGVAADSDGRTCLPAQAVAGLLRQLKSRLSSVNDATRPAAPPDGPDALATRRLQHILDPIRALLEGLETGTIEYDKCAPEEIERGALLERIEGLIAAVSAIAAYEIDRPVHVAARLTHVGPSHESLSSIGRELMFSFRELSRGLAQLSDAK